MLDYCPLCNEGQKCDQCVNKKLFLLELKGKKKFMLIFDIMMHHLERTQILDVAN
jgi:hypothetical protein